MDADQDHAKQFEVRAPVVRSNQQNIADSEVSAANISSNAVHAAEFATLQGTVEALATAVTHHF